MGAAHDGSSTDPTEPAGGAEREWPKNGYWSEGKPRLFIAARPEIGTPYAKPYISLGYGMPHWIWAGIDVNAIITLEMVQAYAGLRAATPILDLAFGVRDTQSFDKGFILPQRHVTRSDVLDGPGERTRYWAWEAEAVAILPLPHAGIVGDLILVRTLDVPRNMYLFEESYRAVIADPFFVTMRVAAVARLLNEDSLRIGVLTEHVFETGRDQGVWRVGPIGSMQLTDHLEAMAGVTFAVASPDTLGLSLGTYGVAGVRWRWASGERNPEAPWRGRFIPW